MLEVYSRDESWFLAVRQQVTALDQVACVCSFDVMVETSKAPQQMGGKLLSSMCYRLQVSSHACQ